MRVLVDTNIVLDVLLGREPWVADAKKVWQASDDGVITGHILACALADIFYIARRLTNWDAAHKAVQVCLEAFEICVADRQTVELAEMLVGNDFEDNLQIACTQLAGLDAIVTRDRAGFAGAGVPVLTPSELLKKLK